MKIRQEGEKQEGQSKDMKSRDTRSAQESLESSQREDEAGTNVENPIMLVEDTVLIDNEAEKNDDGHDVETIDNVDGEGDDADGMAVKKMKAFGLVNFVHLYHHKYLI